MFVLMSVTSSLLSSHGVDIPPIPPTSPPHEKLLKELGVGGVPSATLLLIATTHPPCKQMLAAVVVMLVAGIILLSVIHVVCQVSRNDISNAATVKVLRHAYLVWISPFTDLLESLYHL